MCFGSKPRYDPANFNARPINHARPYGPGAPRTTPAGKGHTKILGHDAFPSIVPTVTTHNRHGLDRAHVHDYHSIVNVNYKNPPPIPRPSTQRAKQQPDKLLFTNELNGRKQQQKQVRPPLPRYPTAPSRPIQPTPTPDHGFSERAHQSAPATVNSSLHNQTHQGYGAAKQGCQYMKGALPAKPLPPQPLNVSKKAAKQNAQVRAAFAPLSEIAGPRASKGAAKRSHAQRQASLKGVVATKAPQLGPVDLGRSALRTAHGTGNQKFAQRQMRGSVW